VDRFVEARLSKILNLFRSSDNPHSCCEAVAKRAFRKVHVSKWSRWSDLDMASEAVRDALGYERLYCRRLSARGFKALL